MHLIRGIFHIDRWLDGIYLRLDVPNILTFQSDGMNDAIRDP